MFVINQQKEVLTIDAFGRCANLVAQGTFLIVYAGNCKKRKKKGYYQKLIDLESMAAK